MPTQGRPPWPASNPPPMPDMSPCNACQMLADCPAMSSVFVCWHSRKWWPPIRGGQLQLAFLRLEKAKWTDFFCKKGISYTYFWWKCKKQDEKLTKTLKKSCFFSAPLTIWLSSPDLVWTKSGRPDMVRTESGQTQLGYTIYMYSVHSHRTLMYKQCRLLSDGEH